MHLFRVFLLVLKKVIVSILRLKNTGFKFVLWIVILTMVHSPAKSRSGSHGFASQRKIENHLGGPVLFCRGKKKATVTGYVNAIVYVVTAIECKRSKSISTAYTNCSCHICIAVVGGFVGLLVLTHGEINDPRWRREHF